MTTIAEILSVASKATSPIYRGAYGYYAYVPYHYDKPHGPTTQISSAARYSIQNRLNARRASIALALATEEFDLDAEEMREAAEALYCRITADYGRNGGIDWRADARAIIRKHRAAR